MKDQTKGFIQLLLVNCIWGGSYVAAKIALHEISPMYLVGLNYLIGSIILSVIYLKHLKKITRGALFCGIAAGLLVAAGTIMVNVGLQYTTSVKGGLLNSMELITIPFILWVLFKDKLSRDDMISVITALFGIIMINYDGISFSYNLGDLLCTVGPMLFALQLVVLSLYKNDDAVLITIIELLVVGIVSAVGAVFFEDINADISSTSLYLVGYLAILSCAAAYYLETLALRNIRPTYAGVINTTMPIFTMIISFVVLGEKLNSVSLLGSLLIIFALLNFNFKLFQRLTLKSQSGIMDLNKNY